MTLEDFRIYIARLTQKELADLAGLSTFTIQQIENNKQNVSKLSKAKILHALSQNVGREVKANEIEEFS